MQLVLPNWWIWISVVMRSCKKMRKAAFRCLIYLIHCVQSKMGWNENTWGCTCVYTECPIYPHALIQKAFSFKRVHWRILRAASINRVTQNCVCWRWDVAEWELNLCGLGALIRPLSWGGRISPFCINSRLSRLTSHLLSPPLLLHLLSVLFCVTLYFSPQRSVFFFYSKKAPLKLSSSLPLLLFLLVFIQWTYNIYSHWHV